MSRFPSLGIETNPQDDLFVGLDFECLLSAASGPTTQKPRDDAHPHSRHSRGMNKLSTSSPKLGLSATLAPQQLLHSVPKTLRTKEERQGDQERKLFSNTLNLVQQLTSSQENQRSLLLQGTYKGGQGELSNNISKQKHKRLMT